MNNPPLSTIYFLFLMSLYIESIIPAIHIAWLWKNRFLILSVHLIKAPMHVII